jgi:ABC-2 type transport system ATP-binding protein
MENAIEINQLRKIYQKSAKIPPKIALDNIDLKIKKGSFFGLLGPNGAGKSTLINILAGLVNKSSGNVKISGVCIDQNPVASKFKIGIVPQELVIDPFFTVYETLEIYAGYYGIKKSQRKTDEIIQALGLQDKAKAKPRSLSGGMRRRLLVAKALVHNPDILVLDEPTAGVDVELRNQLWSYVKKLNQQGTTILLTTHYLEEAEQLCDEIAIINKGKLIACDKKQNLMNLLSTKQLVITFSKPIDNNIFNHINSIQITNNNSCEVVISYDPQKIQVANILQSLASFNAQINDISTKQPDLEEIFKHIIKNK